MNLIVTSIRNEAPWLKEWIAFHKSIGFDEFLIYTNDNTDNTLELLKELSNLGYVHFFENIISEQQSPQKTAFSKAFQKMEELNPSWVLCIDVDEYLVLKKESNINDFLFGLDRRVDAIGFNWNHFGSGGIKKKGDGLTIDRFKYRAETNFNLNRMVKSIFRYNTKNIKGFGPHRPWFNEGVTPNYIYADGVKMPEFFWKEGRNLINYNDAHVSFEVASIHHYSIRSEEEYLIKKNRGNGMKSNSSSQTEHFNDSYFTIRDVNDVYDETALKFTSKQNKLLSGINYSLNKKLNSQEVNLIRDCSLLLEKKDLNSSYKLMKLAHKLRPKGPFISKKIKAFEEQLHWKVKYPRIQINEQFKFFFIHIPKTGGTSIDESNIFESHRYGHFGYNKFKSLLQDDFNSYKCFTLVRNPWDRLASAFYYLSEGGSGNKYDLSIKDKYIGKFDGDFGLFLEDFKDNKKIYMELLHFRPMVDFLSYKDCEIPCFIQKLEDINDVKELNDFLNVDLLVPHKRKRKSYTNIRKVFTDKSFAIVREAYLRDVLDFAYDDYDLSQIKN